MPVVTDRLVFYHVPKTGGTWIESVLWSLGPARHAWPPTTRSRHPLGLDRKHAPPEDLDPAETAGRRSFCVVRDPVSWYRSFWQARHDAGGAKVRRRDRRFGLDACWDQEFDRFLEQTVERYPFGFLTRLVKAYTGSDGRGVDYVGRTESIALDLRRVIALSGSPALATRLVTIPAINRSTPRPVTLDRALRARVLEADRWIVDRFYV